MAKDHDIRNDRDDSEDRSSSQILLASETLRNAARRHIRADKPTKGEEGGISMFWRVFGGTIFSIVALVVITAYTQMTGTISDLRKELTQVQGDILKKDEFNNRLTSIWNTIKELQTTGSALAALNERFKVADDQRKVSADERKELQRKLEAVCLKVQTQAERLAALEGRQSVPNTPTGKSMPILNRKTKTGTE